MLQRRTNPLRVGDVHLTAFGPDMVFHPVPCTSFESAGETRRTSSDGNYTKSSRVLIHLLSKSVPNIDNKKFRHCEPRALNGEWVKESPSRWRRLLRRATPSSQ